MIGRPAKMKMQDFTPAFAQPVATFDLGFEESFNTDLAKFIESMRLGTSGGPVRTSVGGWRNEGNFFAINNPMVKKLEMACANAAMQFLAACGATIPLEKQAIALNGWANWNGKGHYNAPHRHLGADVCGTYYIQQPNDTSLSTGCIEFLDNRNVMPAQQRLGGPIFGTRVQRRPEVGTLVVFPSFLTHWVPPNQGDEGRIVVAWNAKLREQP